MASSEKLTYFTEAIEREIEARRLRAKHQTANDLSKITAEELEAAQAHVNSRIEVMRQELSRKANKRIAAATAEAKAAYIAVRTACHARLREEVATDLHNFAQSEAYTYYLPERVNAIKNAINFEATRVKLPPIHMHHAENIRQATGLEVEPNETAFAGGFIIENKTAKIQADYTFETRLMDLVQPN